MRRSGDPAGEAISTCFLWPRFPLRRVFGRVAGDMRGDRRDNPWVAAARAFAALSAWGLAMYLALDVSVGSILMVLSALAAIAAADAATRPDEKAEAGVGP